MLDFVDGEPVVGPFPLATPYPLELLLLRRTSKHYVTSAVGELVQNYE